MTGVVAVGEIENSKLKILKYWIIWDVYSFYHYWLDIVVHFHGFHISEAHIILSLAKFTPSWQEKCKKD